MTKKTYTPEEAAQIILQKCEELYKNSALKKANTSHELETGSEPNNDEAEAPEHLQAGEVCKEGSFSDTEAKGAKAKKKDKDGNDIEEDSEESEFGEDSEEAPEHEEDMSEKEDFAHDAEENQDDEEDADNIEADEESESEEGSEDKDKKKEKKLPFEKSEKIEKGAVLDLASGSKISDEKGTAGGEDYSPSKEKKMPEEYAKKQSKMKSKKGSLSRMKYKKDVNSAKAGRGIKNHSAYDSSKKPLKGFVDKIKAKKTQKMEKVLGIGEE